MLFGVEPRTAEEAIRELIRSRDPGWWPAPWRPPPSWGCATSRLRFTQAAEDCAEDVLEVARTRRSGAGRMTERRDDLAELNIVEKVIALEGVELLGKLTPEQLARIAAIAQEVKHPARQGRSSTRSQPADALYVIVDGAVELGRNGEVADTSRGRTKCSAPGRCSTRAIRCR